MEISKFKSYKEFVDKKTINKLIYSNMDYYSKRKLKRYIYKELEEKNDKRDLIWEFLNEPIDSEYYMNICLLMSSYSRRHK